MKLFIDECMSPQLAIRLNNTGRYDAVHPLHVGRRGEPDHRVLERCIAEDRAIVTENARDFRRLIGEAEIHPGLIILPAIDRVVAASNRPIQEALREGKLREDLYQICHHDFARQRLKPRASWSVWAQRLPKSSESFWFAR